MEKDRVRGSGPPKKGNKKGVRLQRPGLHRKAVAKTTHNQNKQVPEDRAPKDWRKKHHLNPETTKRISEKKKKGLEGKKNGILLLVG